MSDNPDIPAPFEITGDQNAAGGTIDQIETVPDDNSGEWSANADPAGADPSGILQDEYTDTLDTGGNDAFPATDASMPADFAPDSDFQFVDPDTTGAYDLPNIDITDGDDVIASGGDFEPTNMEDDVAGATTEQVWGGDE